MGRLLLKGQVLASPGLATTERDPRGPMGPWQVPLPENGVCNGLFWPSLSWWPPHPSSSSGFGLLHLVLLIGRLCSDGPKVKSPVVLPPPPLRLNSPQSRAVLEHSGSNLTFHLTAPQTPETQTTHDTVWERTARHSAELAASPSSAHTKRHPAGDHRLLSSVSISSRKDHSRGPKVLTWEHLCVCAFLVPLSEPWIQPP